MPLREDETLVQAFQTGRRYYILLLAFVVDDNIFYGRSNKFIKYIIYSLGFYYTTVAAVNYVNPVLVDNLLPGLRSGADNVKGVLTRNFITQNTGILFPHFSFVLKGLNVLFKEEERNLRSIFLLAYFFVGMFLIGLRAPLFSFIAAFIMIYIYCAKKMSSHGILTGIKQIKYLFIALVLCVFFNELSNDRFASFYQSTYDDISNDSELRQNTFENREKRAMAYQIPMALSHPVLGLGFIYHDTPAAKKYNYDSESLNRVRDLYNMDFGYGTLWITFGLLGACLILYCFIRAICYVLLTSKNVLSPYLVQLAVVILAFLVCNYTWAVLRDPLGLIILAFSISIANEELALIKEQEDLL